MASKTQRTPTPAAAAASAPVHSSAPAPTPAEERKVQPMDAIRFKGAEFVRTHYVCTAHEGTRPEDLLEPEYWAHVSEQMRPRTRVEAWANDGTWMLELVVLEAGRAWARLQVVAGPHQFTTADVAQTQAEMMSPYAIEYRGPHCKWSVIRKSDRQVLHEQEETRDGASGWLREHMKAQR